MIAPYLPDSGSQGATHKIESVLRILARSGRRILFLNSAHIRAEFAPSSAAIRNIAGVRLLQITPFTMPWRPAGKLANVLAMRSLVRRIAAIRPSLVWIYNSYAFEARFALMLSKTTDCRIVLEMEDLPRSRNRGRLNLKPILDAHYLQLLRRHATLITCVNQSVESSMSPARTMPLPYIMSPAVKLNGGEPFQGAPFTLGYFGHLSIEKGVSIFPSLSASLPANWRFTVTGRGPLAAELHACAARSGGRMQFIENAPDEKLYELLSQCDAVVNPHWSIRAMGEGVFPFKVLEAVAAGRLVISTELPPCGFDLTQNVMNFDGTVDGLLRSLAAAPEFRRRNLVGFEATVARVRSALSEDAIYATLRDMRVLP
jgi:glycosyltransferase involved in cell wall biosynthesis